MKSSLKFLIVVALFWIAGALSAQAAEPGTPCIVGDIGVNPTIPTLIQDCASSNGSPVGSPNGYWITITSCLGDKVAVRAAFGEPVYGGLIPGAVVSCVVPSTALAWYAKQQEAIDAAIDAITARLPKGPYGDKWCQALGYSRSINPALGYCL